MTGGSDSLTHLGQCSEFKFKLSNDLIFSNIQITTQASCRSVQGRVRGSVSGACVLPIKARGCREEPWGDAEGAGSDETYGRDARGEQDLGLTDIRCDRYTISPWSSSLWGLTDIQIYHIPLPDTNDCIVESCDLIPRSFARRATRQRRLLSEAEAVQIHNSTNLREITSDPSRSLLVA